MKKEYLKCQNHQQEIRVALETRRRKRQERQTLLNNEVEAALQLMDEMIQLAQEAESGIWSAKQEARQVKVIEEAKAMSRKPKPPPK